MSAFRHVPHPWRHQRAQAGPVKVADQAGGGANGRIALRLTALVGTMQAAYLFALLALIALPGVLGFSALPARSLLIVAWVSQTFIQLVMLAVLQLGQNLGAAGADKRAEATYQDAEAVLHECAELQRHLQAQDDVLERLIAAETSRTEAAARSLSAPAEVLAPAKGTTAAKVAAAKADGPKLRAPGKERM